MCNLGASACPGLVLCLFPVRPVPRLAVEGLGNTLDIVFHLDTPYGTEMPNSINVNFH